MTFTLAASELQARVLWADLCAGAPGFGLAERATSA